jgi:5-methylcytosine-specific restriction endonuclease McrA
LGARTVTAEHVCEHCGAVYRKQYPVGRPQAHYYCGRACQKAATAARNTCTCLTCGRVYPRDTRNKGGYCSLTCYWESLRGKRGHNYDRVPVQCATCGATFEVERGRVGKARYCSYACMGAGQREPKIRKICPVCGKSFEVWPSHERVRYCSHKCHGFAARGEKHPLWKGGRFPFYGSDWHEVRQRIRDRDGYRCQVCGVPESQLTYRLHVHHIIPRGDFNGDLAAANDPTNLISLCRACHRRAESGTVILRPKLV